MRSIGDEKVRDLVANYTRAWEAGDVDGVLALLTEDVLIEMPSVPTWFSGRDAASEFFRAVVFTGDHRRVRLVPTRANGQIAFGTYIQEEGADHYAPHNLTILRLRGERIAGLNAYLMPDMPARFGLPDRLD